MRLINESPILVKAPAPMPGTFCSICQPLECSPESTGAVDGSSEIAEGVRSIAVPEEAPDRKMAVWGIPVLSVTLF